MDKARHLVLTCPHPSPLSASRGFFDAGHFKKTNEWLVEVYGEGAEIDWDLSGAGMPVVQSKILQSEVAEGSAAVEATVTAAVATSDVPTSSAPTVVASSAAEVELRDEDFEEDDEFPEGS